MADTLIISRVELNKSAILTTILALLLLFSSLSGILRPESLYATAELRDAFLPNDVINLAIGLPTLLLWPGAVLFVTYNAVAYTIALTDSPFFVFYLVELALSLVIIFLLLRAMNVSEFQRKAQEKIYEKLTGWVLLGMGLLILFRNVGIVVGMAGLTSSEIGVMAADLVSITAWVSGGVCLLGRKTAGYRMGPAWMFQASLLFMSLLLLMVIQPGFGAPSYSAVDFAVIGVMSLICWVPFLLQLRAIRRVLDSGG